MVNLRVEAAIGDLTDVAWGVGRYGRSGGYGGDRPWVDLTAVVLEAQWAVGRDRRHQRPRASALQLTVERPLERIGAESTAGRPLRLVLDDLGTPVWTGRWESSTVSVRKNAAGVTESVWDVVGLDDLALLGRMDYPGGLYARPQETLDARTRFIAGLVGVPVGATSDAAARTVQATDMAQRLSDELGVAADSYRLAAWMNQAGELELSPIRIGVGVETVWLVGPAIPAGEWPNRPDRLLRWLGDPVEAEVTMDLADTKNQVAYGVRGGTAVRDEITASVGDYGPRTYQRLDLVALEGTTEVQWIAECLSYYAAPVPRLRSITVDYSATPRTDGPAPWVTVEQALTGLGLGRTHVHVVLGRPALVDGTWVQLNTGSRSDWRDILGWSWNITPSSQLLTLYLDLPLVLTPVEAPS